MKKINIAIRGGGVKVPAVGVLKALKEEKVQIRCYSGTSIGAIIATLGCILPSCIIVTLLAYVYMKYRNMSLLQGTLASLRPAVVSMIAKAGVTILISAFFIDGTVNLIRQNVCVEMIIFFVIALVLLRKFKINPILAMVLCGVANVVLSAVKKA